MRSSRLPSLLLSGSLIALETFHAPAQLTTNYAFTQSAGTYTNITGGNLLWGDDVLGITNFDDEVSGPQTIPAFNFNGTVYTTMFVAANGYITFGSAPAGTNYTPISSGAGYTGAISPFGANIRSRSSLLTPKTVRWAVIGNEIVIQWRDVRRFNGGSENFSFQARLNTTTSEIRFVYGAVNSLNNATSEQPEVGLRGPNNTFATNVINRFVGTGAENWNTSLPGTTNSDKVRFTNAAPVKSFTSGQTYTFTPNCTQPAATTSILPNCLTGTYTVQVNVTSVGSAPNIDLVSSVGGLFADDVGVGVYTSPAVPIGTPVSITMVHNGNSFCNVVLGPFTSSCTPPTATTSISSSCLTGTYTVQVNVTSVGSAPDVDLVSSVGGLFADNVGVGSYTSPAVPIGTPVSITLVHNCNSACNATLGPFNPQVTCNGTCLTPLLAIPTNGCGSNTNLNVSIPIVFPGTALGNDVLLASVDLIVQSLINNSDFQVRLISPGGQSRNLMLNRFGNGTNIGNPSTCPSTFLRLIDGGTALTNSTINNVSGNYAPEQSLAGFTGDPNGTWTLRICDQGAILSGSLKYVRLNFLTRGSDDPCAPRPLACGDLRTVNSTAGYPNNLPGTACSFNGPGSSNGVHWWSYTAASSGDVVVSTCGLASFNTRLSVFLPSPTCTNLVCAAMNDDTPGCPGGSSEVRFAATAGQTYVIAVHGSGAAAGTYSISLTCMPSCAPAITNEQCPSALAITPVLADGTGLPSAEDNGCAYVDAPPSCAGTGPVQGVWYTFNSGAFTRHRLTLQDNAIDPGYTATALSYALYSGACSGLGALGELGCVTLGAGTTDLPLVTPGSDVHLLVYNIGGIGVAGTFGLLLEHPGMNDAGITAVSAPTGLVCGSAVAPVVTLKNFGEAPLASAVLSVSIDGGPPVLNYTWTGAPLAYLASTTVALPSVSTPSGAHTLSVSAGTPNGVADEVAGNSSASSAYNASGQTLSVHIVSDNAGSQTTWEIYDAFSFLVVSGGPYANNADVTSTFCLPTAFGNTFSFYVYDSGNNGICCGNGNGSWELRDAQDRVLLRDNGEFTDRSPSQTPAVPGYVNGHEVLLPPGPVAPLANECNVFNNNLLNKVYCNQVFGATTYQFEFSDPDQGFRRRIAVPRRWVKFSEMQTYPLTPGVIYFCRARVDQGLAGFGDDNFGPGCEMAIDSNQVPGCTELIAVGDAAYPANTWSCGVTKAFGGSDKIWCYPSINGTQYRFQFENIGEGYLRNVLRPNYVCILSWSTLPLQNGSTYTVRVESQVNGVWSGFCGADCTVTIVNPPVAGGNQNVALADNSSGVQIWPNPVSDGRMNLVINGLTDEDQRIVIGMYDTHGNRVLAREYDNSGELFNTVLDLDGDLAAGIYLVNISVNGTMHTERVIVQ